MGRTLLLLAAVAAGYAVVYFVLKKKIARTLAAATVLREVREEVNRILVELNQTTHRNVTLLEDRIASLAELLAKTDKKIALAAGRRRSRIWPTGCTPSWPTGAAKAGAG